MSKRKSKRKLNKKTFDKKETIDKKITDMSIPLSSTFNRDSSKTKNTYDAFADLYNCDHYGSIIDRLISFVLGSGFKVIIEDPTINEEVKDYLKSNDISQKIKYFLKDLFVFGNSALSLAKSTNLIVNNIDTQKMTPLFSDSTINELQLFKIEYYYKNVRNLYYIPDYRYSYNDDIDSIDIKKDDTGALITDINVDNCIIFKKLNDFHNSPRGLSIFARFGKNINAFGEYIGDTKDITSLYRSPFLDITVPLSGVKNVNGVDTNLVSAASRYKNWKPGTNIIHSEEEKWEIKEFNQKTIDEDVRRGYMMLYSMIFGGGDILLGDASSSNYATAKALLQLFRDELVDYQNILIDVITKIVDYYTKFYTRDNNAIVNVIFPKPLKSLDDDPQYINQWYTIFKDGNISYSTFCDKIGLDASDEKKKIEAEKSLVK